MFHRARSFMLLCAGGKCGFRHYLRDLRGRLGGACRCFALLPICFAAHSQSIDASITNASLTTTDPTSRLSYRDQWRKLWEDHIAWTRVVIMGILAPPPDGLPGTPT